MGLRERGTVQDCIDMGLRCYRGSQETDATIITHRVVAYTKLLGQSAAHTSANCNTPVASETTSPATCYSKTRGAARGKRVREGVA